MDGGRSSATAIERCWRLGGCSPRRIRAIRAATSRTSAARAARSSSSSSASVAAASSPASRIASSADLPWSMARCAASRSSGSWAIIACAPKISDSSSRPPERRRSRRASSSVAARSAASLSPTSVPLTALSLPRSGRRQIRARATPGAAATPRSVEVIRRSPRPGPPPPSRAGLSPLRRHPHLPR